MTSPPKPEETLFPDGSKVQAEAAKNLILRLPRGPDHQPHD